MISLANQKKSQAKTPDPTQPKYTPVIPGLKYIPVGKYAEIFGISPASVRRQCVKGKIPGAIKFERLWRIPVKEEDLPC